MSWNFETRKDLSLSLSLFFAKWRNRILLFFLFDELPKFVYNLESKLIRSLVSSKWNSVFLFQWNGIAEYPPLLCRIYVFFKSILTWWKACNFMRDILILLIDQSLFIGLPLRIYDDQTFHVIPCHSINLDRSSISTFLIPFVSSLKLSHLSLINPSRELNWTPFHIYIISSSSVSTG